MSAIPDRLLCKNYDTFGNAVRLYGADSLKFPLADTSLYLLYDGKAICERQGIFRDILTYPTLLQGFEKLLSMLDELSSFFSQGGEAMSSEAIVYSLLELRSFCETVDFGAGKLFADIPDGAPLSCALSKLRTGFETLAANTQYIAAREWLWGLDVSLKHVRSVTLGANLDAQLRVCEVGIVSFNEYPYVNSGVFDALLRAHDPPQEYKCIASLGIKETGGLLGSSSVAVNKEFFGAMNMLFKGSAKKLRRTLTDSLKAEAAALMALHDDIAFIVKAARYMYSLRESGLRLSFPQISEKTAIRGLANPNLTDKCAASHIVTSDVVFDTAHRIYVLTGPNSGGKSVYLAAIGIAQLMFQLGLPVCSDTAFMKPCASVAAMFVREIQKSTESRLANEVVRLRECLDAVGEDSLLLLDETFSSTSAYDGVFLAGSLIRCLEKRGCFAVYATHLHELCEHFSSDSPIHLLAAQSCEGRRTYRIIPQSDSSSDESFARDIVIENGLGFLFE